MLPHGTWCAHGSTSASRAAGLNAGDLKGITQNLRSTIGWNIEEEGGPGGVIGQAMKSTGKILSRIGIPDLLGMFLERRLRSESTEGLRLPAAASFPEPSRDPLGTRPRPTRFSARSRPRPGWAFWAFVGLVLSGALRVFTRWPDDKEEADLWEREGHKPEHHGAWICLAVRSCAFR